jgi:hypothetical protein
VDPEHGDVEGHGYDYQAEQSSEEVFEPEALEEHVSIRDSAKIWKAYRSDVLRVGEQDPKLKESQASNPSDCEETNPFYAHCSSETNASSC